MDQPSPAPVFVWPQQPAAVAAAAFRLVGLLDLEAAEVHALLDAGVVPLLVVGDHHLVPAFHPADLLGRADRLGDCLVGGGVGNGWS